MIPHKDERLKKIVFNLNGKKHTAMGSLEREVVFAGEPEIGIKKIETTGFPAVIVGETAWVKNFINETGSNKGKIPDIADNLSFECEPFYTNGNLQPCFYQAMVKHNFINKDSLTWENDELKLMATVSDELDLITVFDVSNKNHLPVYTAITNEGVDDFLNEYLLDKKYDFNIERLNALGRELTQLGSALPEQKVNWLAKQLSNITKAKFHGFELMLYIDDISSATTDFENTKIQQLFRATAYKSSNHNQDWHKLPNIHVSRQYAQLVNIHIRSDESMIKWIESKLLEIKETAKFDLTNDHSNFYLKLSNQEYSKIKHQLNDMAINSLKEKPKLKKSLDTVKFKPK